MILKGLDINVLTNLSSQQIDHVTCLECCKYYVAPTTASCGHTLCHGCWHGRRKCPTCASTVERKTLQLNLPMQKLTEHVNSLIEAFERLFNVKMDEFDLEAPSKGSQDDPNKHVKDWLANSQNQFSAPISSQSPQDPPVEYLTSKIQIHTTNVKMKAPAEVIHVSLPQDDWDKIEAMPDAEECVAKEQLNALEPMHVESFADNEYTTENPRRSLRRNKDTNNSPKESTDMQNEKMSTKASAIVSIKPSKKLKQTWNNVKRMKKEFSKLNKENRNKLNVSIEMCKRTQMSNINTKQLDKEKLTPDIIEINTPNEILQRVIEEESQQSDKLLANNNNTSQNTVKQTDNPKTTFLSNNLNTVSIQGNNDIAHNDVAHKKALSTKQKKAETTVDFENTSNNKGITEIGKVKFIKKGSLQVNTKENAQTYDNTEFTASTDDIEISIKIGNTITNICIKKKDNDVQLKVNTDREIQTTLGTENIPVNNITSSCQSKDASQNIAINLGKSGPVNKSTHEIFTQSNNVPILNKIESKSVLSKKSTASADTKAAQFEITESVEKELSDIMECVENETVNDKSRKNQYQKGSTTCEQVQSSSQKENIPEIIECNDDVDIFDCEILKIPNVQLLKSSKNMPSKILMSTQNKNNKRKQVENTDENFYNENSVPQTKKQKIINKENKSEIENDNTTDQISFKASTNDSECHNYDLIMGKVFANIDKDIETINYVGNLSKEDKIENSPQRNSQIKKLPSDDNQKYSENIFSILDTDDGNLTKKSNTEVAKSTLQNVHSLTPNLCEEFADANDHERDRETGDIEMIELGTPFQENYDSDKSVVEETPQKNVSIPKVKQKTVASFQSDSDHRKEPKSINTDDKRSVRSVINITDSVSDSTKATKENTVIEFHNARQTLETPLTINKFVDQIKHKSTPVARKSLNFNRRDVDENDPERTLCPSTIAAARTTQEREFMNEVFEQRDNSPTREETIAALNRTRRPNKLCIAGSCLTPIEVAKLKLFCKEKGWSYVEKYTRDLTHLVVGVDEENRSQRSVKYMCALAAGKWIVSYAWVEKCLQSQTILPEEPFESLDGTGEPGPRRSRLAKRKLFEGIRFYCMQPFSVLDVETLKEILEASGGQVVDDASEVRVNSERPALLLAEPENTQEDKFIYLAMKLNVVPVNYEWVLNCLGNYTLGPIHELLLCPSALLPPATNKWPVELIAHDYD